MVAEISASAVMALRKMSGQGMMDCKKALSEADGDVELAMEALRKKGVATLEKRSDRETANGLVVSKTSDDGRVGVIASLCCETDFVARSDGFVAAAHLLGDYAMACETESVESLLATVVDARAFREVITECVSKTGEKMEVGEFARFGLAGSGCISHYVHFNGKTGAMVLVEASDDRVGGSEALQAVANDVAMHVTAAKPLALDKGGIDADTVEKEKEIYAEQVKNKPAEIIDKIVEGKLRKFFSEQCLLQQPFVKDDSKSVEQVVSEAAKQAGGTATVSRFVRLEIG
ncbi:MAG: elongation factor Ts [Planctomycetes bacterium]|nr:elongation factor Ts [Planctomycetota bacterium]